MKKSEQKKYERILGEKKVYEMTPEELEAPITKEVSELCRHRLEKRWYRRLIELNIIMIVVVICIFVNNYSQNLDLAKDYINQVEAEVQESIEEAEKANTETDIEKADTEDTDEVADNKSDDKDKLTEDDIPFEVTALGYGLILLVAGYISLYIYYALYRSMGVRITANNFPEVYKVIEEYAARLGMNVPKAYVMQSGGVLNAFSTFLFKRQWICINSEVFEVAYREHQDMDSLKFIIAHEMAHIHYGHATLHYNLPIWFSMQVPVIGAIASRAREYSCDRLAQRLTGVSGIDAMLMLMVDRHLYKMVDKEDYIQEAKSIRGFFVWLVNLILDHPIMSKRIVALDEGRGSGALY